MASTIRASVVPLNVCHIGAFHFDANFAAGNIIEYDPPCDRAANAKEETTGRTGALGFLICVLSPIDDFGEKNIMRLFVLFLD